MTDLNQGTRQRNLRQLSGGAGRVSSQLRDAGGGVPAPSTDLLQALGGHIGGWWIENQRLTADGGNAKLNANVPSISLGAATDYLAGAGVWFGKNSDVYRARIGDPEGHHLKWDGSTLTVVGTISATAGAIGNWAIGTNSISADGGAAVIDSSVPKITLGAASDYLTGAGFFVGKSGGAYSFHVGDPEGNYVKFDGSTGALTLNGTVTTNSLNPALQSFRTNIVFSSTDDDTVSWTAGTIRLASGFTYSIVAGNTGNMTALTYIYLDTSVSLTVLQTTTVYSNAVGDNRLLLAAAQNHSTGTGASVIPFTGQQPIVNAKDQVTARSILAGQIAAGTITSNEITGSTLAAIRANIGAATISDVLTIGTSGGIYQGTGTFASPMTGLKVWNDGGVGRLATYYSGNPQVYLDTAGKLLAAAGNVTLDANGLRLSAATGKFTAASVEWWSSGVRSFSLGTIVDIGGPVGAYVNSPLALQIESSTEVRIQTQAGGAVPLTVKGGLNVGTAMGAGAGDIKLSGNATIDGTLAVGGLAVRPSGDARFLARVSSSILNVTGDGTGYAVIFNTEAYDDGNEYNTANGIFTAPVSGRYHFDFTVALEGITSGMTFAILDLIAGGRTFRSQRVHAFNCFDGAALAMHGSCDAAMTAGQTAYVVIYVFGGTKVVDVTGHATEMLSYFNGHLIA